MAAHSPVMNPLANRHSTGRAAWQVGRELLYYSERLAEPALLALSLATETGLIAVPVGEVRRAGMVWVDGPVGAEATMALLAEFEGFPDLRADVDNGMVVWGVELPLPNAPQPPVELARTDAAVGRAFGYAEPAIRLHLIRRVGVEAAEIALRATA